MALRPCCDQKKKGIAELSAVRSPTSCQDRSVSFLIRSGLAMIAIDRTSMAIVSGMLETIAELFNRYSNCRWIMCSELDLIAA